jgi:hypothetical protein
VISTIALEDLWNELVDELGFSLYCGYPISGFDVQSRTTFEHVCGQHGTARPPRLDATPGADDDPRLEADRRDETPI